MLRTTKRIRSGVVAGVSLLVVLGATLSAFASHGKDGDPISEVPDLFGDGATYGTLKDHDDSTEPNGVSHTTGHNCYGNGGSIYKFQAKIGTRVDLDVTDDIAGDDLCYVEIFRQHLDEDVLPALYGFPEVHDYLGAYSECPRFNTVCREKWIMPEDDTYYLAFWPDNNTNVNYATFRFTVSIRKPTKTKLAIENAEKPAGSKCFSVSNGGSVTANALVTNDATGTVKFRVERRQKGNWKLISTDDQALEESKASLEQRFGRAGKYRLGADYLGDDTRAPSKSRKPCFEVSS